MPPTTEQELRAIKTALAKVWRDLAEDYGNCTIDAEESVHGQGALIRLTQQIALLEGRDPHEVRKSLQFHYEWD